MPQLAKSSSQGTVDKAAVLCGGTQQSQTRDIMRSTEDQFICSIPSSTNTENNQSTFSKRKH